MDRVPSPDQRRQDIVHTVDASSKRDDNESATSFHSVKKNIASASAATTTNSDPSSSTEANELNLSSARDSPRNTSDDDTGVVGGPVHRTLPGNLPCLALALCEVFELSITTKPF